MDGIPSHDDFIKSNLSNLERATAYFKSCLPPNIKSKLDLSRLRQLSETYLDDDLRKRFSDSVYTCPVINTSRIVNLCLLVEHKSHPDKHTPIQIGNYIFGALQKQIKNKVPLSLVIPILLYHGKEKWNYQTLEHLFPEVEEDWKVFLPSFEFIFNNLSELTDKEIETPIIKPL